MLSGCSPCPFEPFSVPRYCPVKILYSCQEWYVTILMLASPHPSPPPPRTHSLVAALAPRCPTRLQVRVRMCGSAWAGVACRDTLPGPRSRCASSATPCPSQWGSRRCPARMQRRQVRCMQLVQGIAAAIVSFTVFSDSCDVQACVAPASASFTFTGTSYGSCAPGAPSLTPASYNEVWCPCKASWTATTSTRLVARAAVVRGRGRGTAVRTVPGAVAGRAPL